MHSSDLSFFGRDVLNEQWLTRTAARETAVNDPGERFDSRATKVLLQCRDFRKWRGFRQRHQNHAGVVSILKTHQRRYHSGLRDLLCEVKS